MNCTELNESSLERKDNFVVDELRSTFFKLESIFKCLKNRDNDAFDVQALFDTVTEHYPNSKDRFNDKSSIIDSPIFEDVIVNI